MVGLRRSSLIMTPPRYRNVVTRRKRRPVQGSVIKMYENRRRPVTGLRHDSRRILFAWLQQRILPSKLLKHGLNVDFGLWGLCRVSNC